MFGLCFSYVSALVMLNSAYTITIYGYFCFAYAYLGHIHNCSNLLSNDIDTNSSIFHKSYKGYQNNIVINGKIQSFQQQLRISIYTGQIIACINVLIRTLTVHV